jgi:amino acid adenylation domain-containing protein
MGMLISTIPCRIFVEGGSTLLHWVQDIYKNHLETNKYSHISLNDIKKSIGINSSEGLLNIQLLIQNFSSGRQESISHKEFSLIEDEGNLLEKVRFNDFDLQLIVTPTEHDVNAELVFKSKHISPTLASNLVGHFDVVMSNLVEKLNESPVSQLCTISSFPCSYQEALLDIGRGPSMEIRLQNAHNYFEYCAESNPDMVAIEKDDESITYSELNAKSKSIAESLLARGVQQGEYVALLSTRSIEMVCAIFGILKAGAAYIPIDSTIPFERIRYILEISEARTVVCDPNVSSEVSSKIAPEKLVSVLELFSQQASPKIPLPTIPSSSAAYVVFTSGSTGKPKGVVISHKSVANYVQTNLPEMVPDMKGKRWANIFSISFDMFTAEVIGTLGNLSTLCMTSGDALELVESVDYLFTTPSFLRKLDPVKCRNLDTVIVAGEILDQSLADVWTSNCRLINAYGPSEATAVATYGEILSTELITIGKPLPNSTHYIVDKDLNLVPFGIPGELVIGGTGVAMGYLNRADLTMEKFLEDHFAGDGTKMYRTGDICQWTEGNKIVILGRADDMVKLKGYRIELDEINSVLSRYNSVTGACTIVKDDNLVTFVTPEDVDTTLLREFALEVLPHYMVPSKFIGLQAFPTNINAKVKS